MKTQHPTMQDVEVRQQSSNVNDDQDNSSTRAPVDTTTFHNNQHIINI